MADQRDPAAAPASIGDGDPDEVADSGAMRWLDWAGGVAAVVLVIIVADIWTDGRLISARLLRWRGQDPGEGGGDVRPGPAAGD
jgi:hypothetical protein